MSWILRQRFRILMRSSLCVVPVISLVAALLVAPLIRLVDERTCWTLLGFGLEGARIVVGGLASALLSFIVFTFSIILLAVQIAGGQLSPRVIARVFESRIAKLTLGVFVFSFVYAMASLGRIENRVPQLPALIAVLSGLLSVGLFLYLIQNVSQSLRPIAVLILVAANTRKAIGAVYPREFTSAAAESAGFELRRDTIARTIVHTGPPGVVNAFDSHGLVKIARQADCVIRIEKPVGDFLAPGEALFHLRGARADAVSESRLRRCVALDSERAMDSDPVFGFRILVEIASKALSPAINDPSTAVLAIDQLEHLLHFVSQRQLDPGIARDASGEVRLVYRTPCWQDYVTLALTEIRLFGASCTQVTRRLQAMIVSLLERVPKERAKALQTELALLRRTIERGFADPEDRVLAGQSDRQGLGSRA